MPNADRANLAIALSEINAGIRIVQNLREMLPGAEDQQTCDYLDAGFDQFLKRHDWPGLPGIRHWPPRR